MLQKAGILYIQECHIQFQGREGIENVPSNLCKFIGEIYHDFHEKAEATDSGNFSGMAKN